MSNISRGGKLGLVPGNRLRFVAELEKELKKAEQAHIPIFHHFGKNVYAREMRMPQECLVIGKIHKFENLNCISKGKVSVLDASTGEVFHYDADQGSPVHFLALPGAKRVIWAHTPVIWTVYLGTSLKSVPEIEEAFVTEDYNDVQISEAQWDALRGVKCLS